MREFPIYIISFDLHISNENGEKIERKFPEGVRTDPSAANRSKPVSTRYRDFAIRLVQLRARASPPRPRAIRGKRARTRVSMIERERECAWTYE